MLSTENAQLLTAAITLIVLVWPLVSMGATAIGERLTERLPQNVHQTLSDVAAHVVSATEQISTVAKSAGGIAPDDRKSKAIDAATVILNRLGIKIPPDMLSTYIEAAVADLPKSGFNAELDPAHVAPAPLVASTVDVPVTQYPAV